MLCLDVFISSDVSNRSLDILYVERVFNCNLESIEKTDCRMVLSQILN